MQIAWSFDRTSLKKIGKGLLISIGGALLAGFVVLAFQMNGLILNGDPINWRAIIYACWGAFSTSLINTAKEFFAGVNRETLANDPREVVAKVEDLVDDIKEQAVKEVTEESNQLK